MGASDRPDGGDMSRERTGDEGRGVAVACGILAVLWAGCAAGGTAWDGSVAVVVRGTGDTPSATIYVAAAHADGSVDRASCGTGGTGDTQALRCTSEGVRLADAGPARLTIKARGYRFTTVAVGTEGADTADGIPAAPVAHRAAVVTLDPLPAAKATPDYRTGFDADASLDDFIAMAWLADSEVGAAQAVKFYVDLSGPTVYYQNTRKHPIHYDFVHDVLGKAVTPAQFEAQTYHGTNRTGYGGTVIRYAGIAAPVQALGGGTLTAPYAIGFFPNDELTPQEAGNVARMVEETLGLAALDGGESRVVYLPAGQVQEDQARADADPLKARDEPWVARSELWGQTSLQVLNPGLAYGTLRHLTPDDLATQIVSFTDVLILTDLPNDLPIVGGTITEQLQTPLAHVNVAAHSRGTPNIALPGAGTDPRVAPLIGKMVRFEAKGGTFTLAEATLADAEAFWASRHPQPFAPAHDDTTTGFPAFADVVFGDAKSVGVKAANLAELHRCLPDVAPDGFAIPFSAYVAYQANRKVAAADCDTAASLCPGPRATDVCNRARDLCRPAVDGEALGDLVARVIVDPTFASDAPLREATLFLVRWLYANGTVDPVFGAALDDAVATRWGTGKVKLRSSTNSEDLEGFSGAGLYTSLGATSADAGQVVRSVWASVWNWRAFEERSFWGVDHLSVRMGVAVHTSFPDEQANGVLVTKNLSDPFTDGFYVNVQMGEVPVTNPEDGSVAEVLEMVPGPSGVQVVEERFSSLHPGGPILSAAEVQALFQAAYTARNHFAPLYRQDATLLALDIEFKFIGTGRRLVVKQARPWAATGW